MLPVLRAERQETAVAASAFPHLKDADRAAMLRELRSHTDPAGKTKKPKPTSLHEALMSIAGIDTVIVPTSRGTRKEPKGG